MDKKPLSSIDFGRYSMWQQRCCDVSPDGTIASFSILLQGYRIEGVFVHRDCSKRCWQSGGKLARDRKADPQARFPKGVDVRRRRGCRAWARTGTSQNARRSQLGRTAWAAAAKGCSCGKRIGYITSMAMVSTTMQASDVTTITFMTHFSMVVYCTFASAKPASTAPFMGVMMATTPCAAT